jgi:SMODS-associating 2TM, beta-strand rich effector domain
MHGYSTDSGERRVVPLLLASVAIALAWVSSRILAVTHLFVPWWLDAPSSLAFYGALNAIFDRYLWRNGLVSKLGLVRIPNLAGQWHGYLLSSFDGHEKRHHLVITIFQSWTQIAVFFTTATSMSRSCAAVIQVDDPEGVTLIYQYQNQPLADAMKTMHMHYGTAMLRVSNGGCLVGDYYAGRDRQTFGRIYCRRQLRSPQSDAESVYAASGAKGTASRLRITDIINWTVKLATNVRLQAQSEGLI